MLIGWIQLSVLSWILCGSPVTSAALPSEASAANLTEVTAAHETTTSHDETSTSLGWKDSTTTTITSTAGSTSKSTTTATASDTTTTTTTSTTTSSTTIGSTTTTTPTGSTTTTTPTGSTTTTTPTGSTTTTTPTGSTTSPASTTSDTSTSSSPASSETSTSSMTTATTTSTSPTSSTSHTSTTSTSTTSTSSVEKPERCAKAGKIPCPDHPEACISETWLCDFVNDCPNGTDEADCDGYATDVSDGSEGGKVIIVEPIQPTERPFKPNCELDGGMMCANESGQCVPRSRICDGIFDCYGGQDETKRACLQKQAGDITDGIAKFAVKLGVFLEQAKETVTDTFTSFYCMMFKAKGCEPHM